MIRIATHIPNHHDATSWYRASGPFGALRKQFKNVHFERIKEWSFDSAMGHDLAFFQRPSTPSELEAIRICKRLNIPVIVDYDDLLFDLPTDNPAYRMYMNKQTQETIISIMREATCIWVSTKELKRCIQLPHASLNEKVYVVPNALDDFHLIVGDKSSPQKHRQHSVIWRGSPTHERDIMDHGFEISDLASKNPDMPFVFVGYNPWFLTENMRDKQAIIAGSMPVGEFMEFLYASGSRIGMVPLHDSRFNRCKSNIAWLEMAWSGGVIVAPDWEEWRQPGVVTYKTPAEFRQAIEDLWNMPKEELDEMNAQAWAHIKENFVLSKTNIIRHQTILACLGLLNDMGGGYPYGWPDGFQRLPDPDEKIMELS